MGNPALARREGTTVLKYRNLTVKITPGQSIVVIKASPEKVGRNNPKVPWAAMNVDLHTGGPCFRPCSACHKI